MDTKIKAWWLGHSAFRLASPSGKIIYIDPFLSQNPNTPEEHKSPDDIDFILLTHGHEDHVGDTLDLAEKTGCKVVAQVELSHLLKKHGLKEEQRVEFNKGGSVHFDDFSVTLVNANHSSSFQGDYAGEAG
ncbi:MAG: MBL fold metallo-hydrolase, partial [Rhodohalobacter sp.]